MLTFSNNVTTPRRIKRRIRSMLRFKSQMTASITLAGIELVHMMRKQQGLFAYSRLLTLKEQFEAIAACIMTSGPL
jgi:putative transposase